MEIRYAILKNSTGFNFLRKGTSTPPVTVENCTSTADQTVEIFNYIKKIPNDFVGFRATTATSSVKPSFSFYHPNFNVYSTGGWNLSNGFTLIFDSYTDGNNEIICGGTFEVSVGQSTLNKFSQVYTDNNGVTHTINYHETGYNIPHAKQITIIPYNVDWSEIRKLTVLFSSVTSAERGIRVFSLIPGEFVVFDNVLSSKLIEEMNILSDDLPINAFEFSAISDKNLESGQKCCVYNNNVYYGTFWSDDVNKVSQNYDGTQKVYEVNCVNIIGVMDKIQYEDATMTAMSGPCLAETGLTRALALAGVEYTIERDNPNYNYGILGHVPIESLRYVACQYGWSIRKWVKSARRDDIVFSKIVPSGTTLRNVLTIPETNILGNATFKKSTPITEAVWQYSANLNWQDSTSAIIAKFPASPNVKKKYYYDNPPMLVDNTKTKFTVSEEWYANYFLYQTASNANNVEIYTIPMKAEYITIKGIDDAYSPNVVNFNHFNCIGVENFVVLRYQDMGTVPSDKHDCLYGLFKPNSYNPIDENNCIFSKQNDIATFIKSKGTVSAQVILKGATQNIQVGQFVKIPTAFDGDVIGIITRMETSFGYFDTANIEIREAADFLS